MSDDPFEDGLSKLFDEDANGNNNVITPPWEKTWIIQGAYPKLAIRSVPGSSTAFTEVNIGFIVGLGLDDIFSKGIAELGRKKAVSSTKQNIYDLNRGFCAFLRSPLEGGGGTRAHWKANHFTTTDLSKFSEFLRTSELSNSARDSRVYAFKNVILAYLDVANPIELGFVTFDDLRKSNEWREMAKNSKAPTSDIKSRAKDAEKFLSYDRMQAINDAAEADVRRITLEWRETQTLIEKGKNLLRCSTSSSPSKMVVDYPLFLGWIDREFPSFIPGGDILRKDHKEFYDVLVARGKNGIGIRNIRKCFHSTAEDLLPFYLLLLIRTRFNSGTLNDIKWTDIADRNDVIVLSPYKARSKKNECRSEGAGEYQDPISLRSIISTLKSMTQRIRNEAYEADRDNVFIHWSENNDHVVSGLKSVFSHPTYGAFFGFLERHGLDKFRVSDIRPTMLDAVANGIEGLEGARREGNHSEATTTLKHYVSIRTAERRRITLAETTHQMDRWSRTEGAIDPRYLPNNADLKSATPGFGCLNPFESPFSVDVVGRLCRSEGHCARCENAFLRSDDPKLVAYVMAYAEAASNAFHLSPEVYDELLGCYIRLLSEVSTEVLEVATQLPKPIAQIR